MFEDSLYITGMMLDGQDPKWLRYLSRHMAWLAVPNLASVFVGLQAIGFFFVFSDPAWAYRLALLPHKVFEGEIWRLVTFLALPLSFSLLWMIFSLWFLYFILDSIESQWGEFKTTFYVLISLCLTVIFSLVFGYPVTGITEFTSTLFLAAAALFPDFEIQVYFFIPIKMKYLGWLALGFFLLRLFQGTWMDRFYLITIYSNYIVFFGPSLVYQIRQWKRRRDYKAKWR